MNTIPASQFEGNEILLKLYKVIVASHEVLDTTAELLIQGAKDKIKGHYVREICFSNFGKNTDSPLILSYECDVWIEPDYDVSTFVDEVGHLNAVPYIMVINSITFYEDENEKKAHSRQLELEAMAKNAQFNYLTHIN